jgi:phytoene dehydrogenase-like protein
LDGKSRVAGYKAGNPEYMPGGNGEIPARLFDIAKKNSTLLLNTRVTEISIQSGKAVGVKTVQGEFTGRVVVSNAGLRPTVLHLTKKENWPDDYYLKVKEMKRSLKVVNIFLTFSRGMKLPAGMSVFLSAVDVDMDREFRSLAGGSFSGSSMFILQVPSNVEPHSDGDHRGTLQFYYPAGDVGALSLEAHVDRIMRIGLDTLFEGLSKAVTGYTVYDPVRYEEAFGFPPYVFGAAPDLNLNRFPVRTPVTGLYCVGDSVAPDGPCVPQALESGIDCARSVEEALSN